MNFSKAFDDVWTRLFTTPIHLDSALSKLPKPVKSAVARVIQPILLRPVSLARSCGVKLTSGEPWSVVDIQNWKPVRAIAERLNSDTRIEGRGSGLLDFPQEMTREWIESFGKAGAEKLGEVLSQDPPLSLRASRIFGSAKLLELLENGQPSPLTPFAVRLPGYTPVMGFEEYKKGFFEIQDEGSQLMSLFALWPEQCSRFLQKAPGPVSALSDPATIHELPSLPSSLNVVDACAGAGGKSLAMADALKGRGRVYSYDISERKLQALRRRATRAGLTNIQAVPVIEGEEQKVTGKFEGRVNVVLVDAPCSGWGVLRRNPDIKWRQDQDTLQKLPAVQARLLSEYSRLVVPGGRLIFGVCTFRKSETVDIVNDFLEKHSEFTTGPGGYLGPGPSDGFFMQAFFRRGRNP